jgi:hypothetical protein
MLDTGAVEIYVIDHRNVPRSTLIWEFIVKTYLTHCNTVEFENTGRSWAIDQDAKLTTRQMINGQVTNAHRIKAIKNVINLHKQLVVDNNNDRFLKNPRVTALDYNCLFRAGGSYYLCEKFNLTAEVRLHEYWDHMLSVIKSPDSIDALGYTWRKTDFFN